MRCSDFLERYSDLRDGQIDDAGLEWSLAEHLRRCPQCTRYHARIARGMLVLRAAAELEPSPGFRRALASRLAGATHGPALPTRAGAMTWLLLVTALAFLMWEISSKPAGSTRRAQVLTVHPPATSAASAHRLEFPEFAVPAFLTRTQSAVRPESAFVAQTAIAR